jgi:hypothetical protein
MALTEKSDGPDLPDISLISSEITGDTDDGRRLSRTSVTKTSLGIKAASAVSTVISRGTDEIIIKKAAEEAKRRLEEMQKTGKFPVDDFFGNVFNVPSEKNDGIESDDPDVDDVTIVSDTAKPSENAQNTESASNGENTDCLKNKSDSDENDN